MLERRDAAFTAAAEVQTTATLRYFQDQSKAKELGKIDLLAQCKLIAPAPPARGYATLELDTPGRTYVLAFRQDESGNANRLAWRAALEDAQAALQTAVVADGDGDGGGGGDGRAVDTPGQGADFS